jgi:2-keto-4-pentenoate hydratase/2-oxohepta-3-ene-1,7-dioic acid hydratase in catechol pathway
MRLARVRTPAGPQPAVWDDGEWAVVVSHFACPLVPTGERYPADAVTLLAPAEPTVVLGMAHNTGPADRALPPQAFAKSARTVMGPGGQISIDPRVGAVAVEAELAVVIGHTARNLTPDQVPGAILGYTIGNDVTAVDQIALDEKMTQSKNGDGFTPLGPWIETVLDPDRQGLEMWVDGRLAASSSTANLAWTVAEQLVYLTSIMTLGPGDVVLTGAPGTTAPIAAGQRCEAMVSGIGHLGSTAVAA